MYMFPLMIIYLFLLGIASQLHLHDNPKIFMYWSFCLVILCDYMRSVYKASTRQQQLRYYAGMMLFVTIAGYFTAFIGDI